MEHEFEQFRKLVRDEWTVRDTVGGWARWHPKITAQQVNMREALIEHARLERGVRVLDLACGTSDPAIEIARRIAPTGRVTATDLIWQHLYDIAIPLRPLFDGLSGDERSAAIDESVAGYAKYYDGKTVNVPASIVTVSARATPSDS